MPPLPIPEFIQPFLSAPVALFAIFALGAVATAVLMVLNRNPVRSALFLVLNLFSVAVLYLLLNAYFLAAVQIIVYAGAIMVLFLFVIMLLNLGAPDRSPDRLRLQQPVAVAAGIALAIVVGVVVASSVPTPDLSAQQQPAMAAAGAGGVALPSPGAADAPAPGETPLAAGEPDGGAGNTVAAAPPATPETMGTPVNVGRELYDPRKPWLFPFEVTSILLLVAVIGSVVLARRRTGEENLGEVTVADKDGV